MKAPQPIHVAHLFPEILDHLIRLLRALSAEDWHKPTVCSGWTVKDIVQHLIGVEIGNISRKRDKFEYTPEAPIQSTQDLVESTINSLNESWAQATKRISPPLLIDLLEFVGGQANDFFLSLDPYKLGESVSWVRPDPAPIWLDLAREYTERWHHQQHIRDATGKPGLKEPRFLAPALDAFVRALPHTYRDVIAPDGCSMTLAITGDAGGVWTIRRDGSKWELYVGRHEAPQILVCIDQDDAWRLFTKGIDPEEVKARSEIRGDKELGLYVFEMVSIIA
jgi:uncharacterized protein (TIGR03083 family)